MGDLPHQDVGLFPADILVGQVAQGPDRRLRVRLSADYERLDFLRVLRALPKPPLTDPGDLVLPEAADDATTALAEEEAADG